MQSRGPLGVEHRLIEQVTQSMKDHLGLIVATARVDTGAIDECIDFIHVMPIGASRQRRLCIPRRPSHSFASSVDHDATRGSRWPVWPYNVPARSSPDRGLDDAP